jgi:hypothetical protein
MTTWVSKRTTFSPFSTTEVRYNVSAVSSTCPAVMMNIVGDEKIGVFLENQ